MAATILIKRYANRRLYDTDQSAYITLEDLAEIIGKGREIQVVDAKSGEDLTRRVLVQVLLTDEHADKLDCLPPEFLRTLLTLRDPSMRQLFERYVGVTLNSFALAQQTMAQNLDMLRRMAPNPADLLGIAMPFLGGRGKNAETAPDGSKP